MCATFSLSATNVLHLTRVLRLNYTQQDPAIPNQFTLLKRGRAFRHIRISAVRKDTTAAVLRIHVKCVVRF